MTALVRKMAAANPLWGAPRIHGEPLKLGFDIAERTEGCDFDFLGRAGRVPEPEIH
jgi:hypothetical protein